MYHALLLNFNYQVLEIVTERKAIKLLFNEKVDILEEWDDQYKYILSSANYPAVIRMRYLIKRPARKLQFSRYAVFRRDNYKCQYCGTECVAKEMTIDHIIPRTAGGQNTFLNCVASCYPCNNKKGWRTIEQAGLRLLKNPTVPMFNNV